MAGCKTWESSPVGSIAEFTTPKLVISTLRGRDLPAVLHELSATLWSEARIPDLLGFYHAVLSREYLCSTVTSHGMAFPHATVPGLPTLSFAFGRCQEPLAWGQSNGAVRMVFLSAIPASGLTTYLSLIPALARLACNHELMQKLHNSSTSHEILELFEEVKFSSHVKTAQIEDLVRTT